jgi:hypothetical protein
MNVLTRTTVSTMRLETKYLRLRTPVTLGSRFGDWEVTWLGGWSRHKLHYLVMVVRVASEDAKPQSEPGSAPSASRTGPDATRRRK